METTSDICSFREEDFRLFQGDGPSDRRLNKQRLELKERLRRMGEKLLDHVPVGWAMESGTEHPAVWNRQQVDRLELFFLRSEEERKILQRAMGREIPMSLLLQSPSPLYAHASLGFFIDAHGVETGFRIPFLAVGDRHQLRKIMESATPDSLKDLELPEGFLFGVFSDGQMEAFDVHSPQGWLAALKKLEEVGLRDHRSYVGLVWQFSPEIIPESRLEARIESIFSRLRPFVQAHVWSHERDLLGVDGLIHAQNLANQSQWERAEKERQQLLAPKPVVAHPILSSRDAAASRTAQAPAGRAAKPAAESRKNMAKAQPPQREGSKPDASATPAKTKTPAPKPNRQPASPKAPQLHPVKNPAVGDVVVLSSGLFAGKEAVVLDLLSDGQLRVRVGMMQLLVNIADVQQARR